MRAGAYVALDFRAVNTDVEVVERRFVYDPLSGPSRRRRLQAASSPSDHDGRLFWTAARMQPVGCEEAVEKLNRDRALANCRRHALHRAVSSVAGREHPRHARLERKRTAIERPRVVVAKIRPREDETP
ncbi:MAG TPA: hypothetical protein VK631_25505, partial [Solirubrobacteraceae bacterium]|nr:hypothetical protein [Solirubrobacteraceae bacterium]